MAKTEAAAPTPTIPILITHVNIMGLFFRLAGGEKSLKLPALFQYPWYDAEAKFQRFPYKTFSMLMSFLFIFFTTWLSKMST
jgi:hypothetical protein